MTYFANQAFTEGKTFDNFYRKLIYQNMYAHESRQHGAGNMAVSYSALREYTFQLKTKVRCCDSQHAGGIHTVR